MSLLERAISSRGSRDFENGDSSDTDAQFWYPSELSEESREELSSYDSFCWEDFASEDDLVAPIIFQDGISRPPESNENYLKGKGAILNHRGVHFRQKNKKFVARLYSSTEKSRKLELGEYNTHDEAARAYHVGAFYYNKPICCGKDNSFLETLPVVPDNLSGASRLAWVRERARHSAASIGTSETPHIFTLEPMLESGGSSFNARPGTPASYGTQGSCDDYHSTPTTPTTSGSAYPTHSYMDSVLKEMEEDWLNSNEFVSMYKMIFPDCKDSLPSFIINERVTVRKGKSAAPHNTSESKRRRFVQTKSQGSPNVELQQGRTSNALTNQTLVVDQQGDPQVKMTDSILYALIELRKQGWEWTLKRRSQSSVEAGVLFSVPKGQHAAPALCITDMITNSFHELREQGWEVHLQPHGGGEAEGHLLQRRPRSPLPEEE